MAETLHPCAVTKIEPFLADVGGGDFAPDTIRSYQVT